MRIILPYTGKEGVKGEEFTTAFVSISLHPSAREARDSATCLGRRRDLVVSASQSQGGSRTRDRPNLSLEISMPFVLSCGGDSYI